MVFINEIRLKMGFQRQMALMNNFSYELQRFNKDSMTNEQELKSIVKAYGKDL